MSSPFRRRYEARMASRRHGAKATTDGGENQDAAIARINELTRAARPIWFMLLGYFAFAIITLLGVEDADFFIESRKTQLPLVNVSIPTSSFFLFAPMLGAAVYVYFHFQLLKLWEALSVPDAVIDGKPLSEHLVPWLISDFGLWLRSDDSGRDRALRWLSNLVVFSLVFVAAPVALFTFWLRSFPAHDERTTLIIGVSLVIAFTTFLQSLLVAFFRLRLRRDYGGGRWHLVEYLIIVVLFLPVGTVSWMATEEGRDVWPVSLIERVAPEWMAGVRESLVVWSAELAEEEMVPHSSELLDYDVHRRRFRVEWCSRQGLSMEVCGPYAADGETLQYVTAARSQWCEQRVYPENSCQAYLGKLDREFNSAWRIERRAAVDALESRNLRGADLRRADLTDALLIGADLREARLDYAKLRGANLEGVDLRGARLDWVQLAGVRLQGADLREARLEGAVISGSTDLEGAKLFLVVMRDAILIRARLDGMDLTMARLQGAVLSNAYLNEAKLGQADLQGADLRGTQLAGALLVGTHFDGAYLSGTDLNASNLRAATLNGAALRSVDLAGVQNLEFDQINSAFGDGSVSLPEGWRWPRHWPRERLGEEEFYGRWRHWREVSGLAWPPPGRALQQLEGIGAVVPE